MSAVASTLSARRLHGTFTMAHHFTFVRLTPMHPDCAGSPQNDESLQMLVHLHALLYFGAVLSRIEGVECAMMDCRWLLHWLAHILCVHAHNEGNTHVLRLAGLRECRPSMCGLLPSIDATAAVATPTTHILMFKTGTQLLTDQDVTHATHMTDLLAKYLPDRKSVV